MARPVMLLIRDGWGINPGGREQREANGDATMLARTPFHDELRKPAQSKEGGKTNPFFVDLYRDMVATEGRGIEAREADNTCRYPDLCPSASGAEAKAALSRIAVGRLKCVSFGPSYRNVDARCETPKGSDVSCEMMRSGTVVRWPRYDPEGRLLGCMPARR